MSYDPAHAERDACGVAALADVRGPGSHALLQRALLTLEKLSHRGARVRDEFGGETGDGCGILTDLPHALFAEWLSRRVGPVAPGDYAVAQLFLPRETAAEAQSIVAETLRALGLPVVGWREVPVDEAVPGKRARETQPLIAQLFALRPAATPRGYEWEQALLLARKAAERELALAGYRAYVCSFSSRTLVYKGMLTPAQLPRFFLDLRDPRFQTRSAVVHTRFSTNTVPSWERAQPFRRLCHNGEINTLQGNIQWMRAREALLPAALCPVVDERGSDSAMLDNAVELLVLGANEAERRTLPHALAMVIPPAWESDAELPARQRAFYASHAALQEPWDGPAGICFADGLVVGAALDRNGLRPMRWDVTHDGWLVVASEAGAAQLEACEIAAHGRLAPGEMIAADLEERYWLVGEPLRERLATRPALHVALHPGAAGADAIREGEAPPQRVGLAALQAAFGYTAEELQVVLKPMAWGGAEAIGSMGDDTPHAVLSEKPRPLAHYFKQRFAEVTNPAIDPLRERDMMSLRCHLGPLPDPLARPLPTPTATPTARFVLPSPFLSAAQLAQLEAGCTSARVDATFPTEGTLEAALAALLSAADEAVAAGATLLILSDRATAEARLPIPSLLALSATHNHLLRVGLRARVALVSESGEARDTHSLALLLGYGANAVCPWLALESAVALGAEAYRGEAVAPTEALRRFLHAAEHGLLKIMAKMGIGPVESYIGAQLFECIGLSDAVVARHFAGTPNRMGGVGVAALERELRRWHAAAWQPTPTLDSPGFYKFKKGGEVHAFSPAVVHALHRAVRTAGALNGRFAEGYAAYRRYVALVEEAAASEPRDLLHLLPAHQPLPLDEVEPLPALFRRFSTAAMSLGSLSREAHETLAIAMSRLGGLSNSGEGGEDPGRFGDERNSGIKQVASGRFGVTPAYLLSARELQIKVAQGSKPGEGGQLPGHKVTAEIAALRHTIPGVALISPPPHHDIYSIEDLAQLIFDLRAINPSAVISVKLVAQAGVGVIAAGVVKAGADVVVISGHSGGTGASPLSSIKHAGEPWEFGLAETQQQLVEQRLRGRVRLRVDGGLRTGRDVVVAALLGADEFSFGTTALIAEGCLMARACHKNSCPVGIATQRPELRAKFDATPEQVMAFFTFLAQEVRERLAQLGAHTLDEIVGRSEWLEAASQAEGARSHPAADSDEGFDLSALLRRPALSGPRRNERGFHEEREASLLDERIAREVLHDLAQQGRAQRRYRAENRDRALGATLAGALLRRPEGAAGDGPIALSFEGYAGQSFGAFALAGTTLTLFGLANDYVGKGLAGGTLELARPEGATWDEAAPLLGNVALYGATAGRLFAAGSAGERFAVRNSGATAVVEGLGAHGCEYMTGGTVVVLGEVGRNFAAGMTGGRAFVFDPEARLPSRLNREFVTEQTPDEAQWAELHALVVEHEQRTGSPRARRLLASWQSNRSAWKLVIQAEALPPAPITEVAAEAVPAD